MRRVPRVFILLAVMLSPPLFADDGGAAAWMTSEPRARAYEASRADILAVFSTADHAGVPLGLLLAKLKEGVAKRVTAGSLVTGLRVEAQRLSVSAGVVDRYGGLIDPGGREQAIRRIGLLLAGGASLQSIQSVLDAASGAGRGSSDTVEALGVLAQMTLSLDLTDVQLQGLGTSLLRSRMKAQVFASLLPVLLQARARGMSAEAAVEMVDGVLASGGGLIQMQDRLQAEAQAAGTSLPGKSGSAPGRANRTPGGQGGQGGPGGQAGGSTGQGGPSGGHR